jgi:hypothetical protein
MKFRSHINLAVALFCGSIFILHSFSPRFLSLPLRDLPLSLGIVLLGAGIVDIDLWWKGPGHRVTSLFHILESPLIAGTFFTVLSIVPVLYIPIFLRPFWVPLFHTLLLLCVGWFFHLVGDIIEGGIWSIIFHRRVGIVWFKWDRYNGTCLGNAVDFTVALTALVSVYYVISAIYYSADTSSVRFIPDAVNSTTGWNIPSMSGILLIPVLWGICMMWGKGGFKGFFWRFLFISAGIGVAVFVFCRYNPFL